MKKGNDGITSSIVSNDCETTLRTLKKILQTTEEKKIFFKDVRSHHITQARVQWLFTAVIIVHNSFEFLGSSDPPT